MYRLKIVYPDGATEQVGKPYETETEAEDAIPGFVAAMKGDNPAVLQASWTVEIVQPKRSGPSPKSG